MNGRILIVDDEKAIRQVLEEYFVNLGYEVKTAEDGDAALKIFKPDFFDVVISDLFMPKIDGLDLLKQIRAKDKSVVFLMITGYPSLESAVEAVKAGAFDYITKPFKFEDIRIKFERAIYSRNLEKSLKKTSGLLWGLIISIPIWLIMGIILGLVWKWF